jgi:poly(A) polymerase
MKLRELLQQMEEVQKKIGSSRAYICGGTPRDRYMKHLENISDLDITTGDKSVQYLSQEFADMLGKKYNITMKSMDDGHSSIYIGSFKMDFSSNFNVPGVDAILRRQGIINPSEMQKEMFSRDFTCNALLLSLDLKDLVDPTHRGFKDIGDRKIRTCLAPEVTLTSNRNRVIRAIYLSSKLDFDIDDSIISYVRSNPKSLKISTETSLREKLTEAFTRDADRASSNITKMNLWNEIPIIPIVYPYYIKHKGVTNVPK